MLALERQREIVELLSKEGSARVAALAGKFGVTEETIRRDLDRLEAQGKIVRSHGGAMPAATEPETPFWRREVRNEVEKADIARAAVEKIQEGDRILLDSSTTTWHMARRLKNMPLTVITNSAQTALVLAALDQVEVIGLGGRFSARSYSFIGPITESQLKGLHADKVFMSCEGVDADKGVSDPTESHAQVKRAMLDSATEGFLLVDHSKFTTVSLARVCGLHRFSEMITDQKADEESLRRFREAGLRVRIA